VGEQYIIQYSTQSTMPLELYYQKSPGNISHRWL